MYKFKCPHCGVKLGNFLYADACPYCHEELKHNTRPLIAVSKPGVQKLESWPVLHARALFSRIVRFVES